MFESTEQAYDAFAEFWLSAPSDKHVAAWEWACSEFEGDVDDADKKFTPPKMLRAMVSQAIELMMPVAYSEFEHAVSEMFDEIDWVPTCWKVRSEQYMAERMADELKD